MRKLHAITLGLLLGFGQAQADTPSVAIQTAPVQERLMAETLKVYGVLDADPGALMSVSLPHAGLIEQVHVRAGQRVSRGDALITLATAPEGLMQYRQAVSAVEYARRELARVSQLFTERLATNSQVDAAKRALADAQAALAALTSRGQGEAREVIRAPMDGFVTAVNVTRQQRVAAETNVLSLAGQEQLVVRLGIEPKDLATVKAGAAVTLAPVFAPEVSIAARLREVHGMLDPTTRLVEAIADIPGSAAPALALGSRVVGSIPIDARQTLAVPASAVLSDDEGAYLFVVDQQHAHRVAVRPGHEERDYVEVAGALSSGQPVVISGNYELVDGMAVREVAP